MACGTYCCGEYQPRGTLFSPDGGRAGAVLSGVHHPADVALHGGVGTVSGLPLPGGLETQGWGGGNQSEWQAINELFGSYQDLKTCGVR